MRCLMIVLACLLSVNSPAATQDPAKLPVLSELFRIDKRRVTAIQFEILGNRMILGGDRFVSLITTPDFKTVQEFPVLEEIEELGWDTESRFVILRFVSNSTVIRELPGLKEVKFSLEPAVGSEVVPQPAGRGPMGITWNGTALMANVSKGLRLWATDGLAGKPRTVTETGATTYEGTLLNHVTAIQLAGKVTLVGQEEGYVSFVDHLGLLAKASSGFKRDDGLRGGQFHSLKQACAFRPHTDDVASLALSPDGKTLITAGAEGKIKVWPMTPEVTDRRAPARNEALPPKQPVPQVTMNGRYAAVQPDTGLLAVAENGGVRIYDATYKRAIRFVPMDPKLGRFSKLLFNPDGSMLAALACSCSSCDSAISSIPGPRKRPYEHAGRLVIWDTRGLK